MRVLCRVGLAGVRSESFLATRYAAVESDSEEAEKGEFSGSVSAVRLQAKGCEAT